MKPFLKYVAEDLYKKYGNRLADIAVVFPNKRAGLFFNQYLKEMSEAPLWSPVYMTINELFEENSDSVEGDPILLVSKLYNIYCKHTHSEESLDRFYYWGELLIKDFDDIDKNMADVEKLFGNLKELREMGNATDTLDEEQREAIEQFFINFKQEDKSEIKQRFLAVWEVLLPIYNDFREALRREAVAYSGMLCRDVIENKEKLQFPHEKYVFVGFNALNRVEDSMFRILQEQGKALFYWDYDNSYVANRAHEAGLFMRANLKQYPNALTSESYDHLSEEKKITFVAASTENIQTRFLADWLDKSVGEKEIETAVVLCNEGILEQVLHTIPPVVKNINVTMGYPVSHTPIYSFMQSLADLQTKGYDEMRGAFRYDAVRAMLKHPYTMQCSENAIKIERDITHNRDLFPSSEVLHADDFLKMVFTRHTDNNEWMMGVSEILYTLTKAVADGSDDVYGELFHESIFSVYIQAQRMMGLLETGEVQLQLRTLAALFMRVIGSLALPFHGEPVVGLQVMGLLETRNLDFKNLILLSANEGNLPRSGSDNSFIPHNLRRAFGLMLTEQRNAVYAYNFYRLIQRAENVTMLYNSSAEGAGQGERSRYMLQLLAERGSAIEQFALSNGQSSTRANAVSVAKTPEIISRMRSIFDAGCNKKPLVLSPSGINRYINCRLEFFYYYIANLKVEKEIESTVEASDFGNIFHKAAELFYEHIIADGGSENITKSQLEPYIKKDALLYPFIDKAFKECFFLSEKSEKPEYDGMQYINREVIHRFMLRLVKMDANHAPFKYVDSEQQVSFQMTTQTADGSPVKLKIGGRIDRIDQKGDTLEIIDYKTGGKSDTLKDVAELFARTGKRNGYIFQAMLYSAAKAAEQSGLKISPSLLYIHKLVEGEREKFVVNIGKKPVTDFSEHQKRFLELLQKELDEIFDINTPFNPTDDKDRCKYCDYKALCGR